MLSTIETSHVPTYIVCKLFEYVMIYICTLGNMTFENLLIK